MTLPRYDTAVFGAGPAGLSIANFLGNHGERVLLIDPNRPAGRPEGSPAGMVNPSAGRKANLSWRHKQCYDALRNNLDRLSGVSKYEELYTADGVIRPAINEELAEHFRAAIREQKWPEGWVSWLDSQEIRDLIPEVASNNGGLFLHCGLTVYVREYLHSYLINLIESGIDFLEEHVFYEQGSSIFDLKVNQRKIAGAEKIVVAAGADTLTFQEWEELRIEPVKGELVVYKYPDEIPWRYGISALGYVLRREENLLIAGSTYERNFGDRKPTVKAARQIHDKFSRMLPGLTDRIKSVHQLTGVRATTTNHLPIIGPHYKQEKLYIYTGLGSKGLLFSEYLASLLGNFILNGKDIPDEVSSLRRGAVII